MPYLDPVVPVWHMVSDLVWCCDLLLVVRIGRVQMRVAGERVSLVDQIASSGRGSSLLALVVHKVAADVLEFVHHHSAHLPWWHVVLVHRVCSVVVLVRQCCPVL